MNIEERIKAVEEMATELKGSLQDLKTLMESKATAADWPQHIVSEQTSSNFHLRLFHEGKDKYSVYFYGRGHGSHELIRHVSLSDATNVYNVLNSLIPWSHDE